MSFKRVLALVLALTMVFSLAMPGTWAFAEEDDGIVAVEDEYNDEGIVEDPVEEEPAVTEETPAEEPAEEIVVDEQPAEEPEEESEEPEEEFDFDFDELSLEDTERFEKIVEGNVASVGSKGYNDIADAVIDANEGLGDITLLANITDPVTINNTGDDAYEINGSYSMDVVTVQAGTVTFSNSSIANLTVSGGNVKVSGVAVGTISVTGGTLTLDGATVSGNVSATNNGTLVATGTDVRGTLTVDQADVTLGDGNQIVSARDNIVYVSGKLTITGGTYGYVSGTNAGSITGGTFTRIEKSMLKEGYYTDPSTGWINGQTWCSGTVKTLDPAPVVYVSKSDVDKVYYSTLADAIEAVDGTTATTITLIKDGASTGSAVRTSAPSVEGKNIILDLNGKTLNGAINVKNGGSLTLRNGILKNTNADFDEHGNDVGQGVNVHAMSGNTSFTLAEDAEIIAPYGIILREAEDGASSVINVAGKVTGNVWVIGSINVGENTINVSGEIDNTADGDKADGAALAVQGLATANIQSSAVITGPTGIEVRGGSLNVADGAKITGTGIPTTVTPNNNGTTSNGVGIAISPYNINDINVTINGGEIKGYTALLITQTKDENTKTVNADVKGGTFTATNGGTNAVSVEKIDVGKFISGGTFSSKPDEELLAKDFVPELVNGNFVVHKGSFPYRIAKAGTYTDLTRAGDGYATLAEVLDPKVAFDPDNMLIVLAAVENDQITLPVGSSINVATGTDAHVSIQVANGDAQTIDEDTTHDGYTTYTARLKQFNVEVRRQDGTKVFNQSYNYGDKVATPTDENVPVEPKPTGTHEFVGYTYQGANWSEGDELSTWNFESDELNKDTIKDITDGATVVLTEKWSNKTYTVRLVGNEGVTENNATFTDLPAICNNTLQLPANPFTYAGHHFLGWKLEGNNKTFTDEYSFTANQINGALKYVEDDVLTLTAQWAIDTFTVAYNPNGGTGTMTSQPFDYGVPQALTANTFTKTGYHFDHWAATNIDNPVATYTDAQSVTLYEANDSTYTLYADWEPNTYTINFAVNAPEGATVVDDEMDPITATYDQSYLLRNGFDVEGYTFAGWKTASESVISHTKAVKNLRTTNNGAVTLKAQWEINTFKVSFDGNGNTNDAAIATMSVDYGSPTDLPANTFEKTGYHSLGWAPNASAKVATYTNTITVPDTHVASDTTLYVVWAPNTYTINFAVNAPQGATVVDGEMDPITATYDQSYLLVNGFDVKGYTFAGWKTTSGGVISHTKAVKNLRTTDNGAVTLNAQWTPTEYTITLDADGGLYATDTMLYTVEDTINLDAPTWTENQRVFKGWRVTKADADGNWKLTDPVATGTDITGKYGNVTLTAQWTGAEASLTDGTGAKVYYDTIEEAIDAFNEKPVNYKYIQLESDDVTTELAFGATLKINLNNRTGFEVNVTEGNENSYEIVPTPDATDPQIYTYSTAAYVAKVSTYTETEVPNPDWTTSWVISSDPAVAYFTDLSDAYDTANMADAAEHTINVVTLLSVPAETYPLSDQVLYVDYGEQSTSGVTKADSYRLVQSGEKELAVKNGTVKYTEFSAVEQGTVTFNTLVENQTVAAVTLDVGKELAWDDAYDLTGKRSGYEFSGWKLDGNKITWNAENPYVVTGNVELVADWGTETYTLKYQYRNPAVGGAFTEFATTECEFGAAITIPEGQPETEGFTFNRWIGLPENMKMPAKDVTATAFFDRNSYTVTFEGDGTESYTDRTVAYAREIGAIADPELEGYTFTGWTIAGAEIYTATPTTMPAEDLTYTANWSLNSYKLKFQARNDEGKVVAVQETTVPYGNAIAAPAENPTRTGFTFLRWDNDVPATMPAKDLTFTAVWSRNSYTITFDVDGGDVELEDRTLKFGDEIDYGYAGTKAHYSFTGWTVAGEEGAYTTLPTNMPAEDLKFTAVWTGDPVKISYYDSVNDALYVDKVEYNTDIKRVMDDFAGDNDVAKMYKVLELYTDPAYDSNVMLYADDLFTKTIPEGTKATRSATYLLKFLDKIPVTFQLVDGYTIETRYVGSGKSLNDTYAEIADPVREGYTFSGWTLNGSKYDFDTAVTQPITLVATWGGEEPVDEECADFSYSMSLTDSLNMKFYVRNIRDEYEVDKFVITVTVDGGESPESQTFTLSTKEVNVFPIASLDARRMTDNIHVDVAYDGKSIWSDDYTIQAYCEDVLAQSTSEQLNALVNAVLVYGANAQVTLGYNPENPPIDSYNVSGVAIPSMKAVKRGQATGVTNIGDRIRVEATITLDVVVQLADGVDPATIKAYVDSETDARTLTKLSGNLYYVSIPVSALRLDTNHTVTLEAEDGSYAMYSGSALAPLSRAANDLAKAVYAYFNAAQNYYGSF